MKRIIITIIIFSLLLAGCNKISGNGSPAASSSNCENEASKLVPSSLNLIHATLGRMKFADYINSKYSWKDGTSITDCKYSYFEKGKKAGQNENYYYNSKPCKYSKRITDSSGNIKGDFKFDATLVLKPMGSPQRDARGDTTQNFQVIDHNIVSCSKP